MILIVGASGKLGREVARRLLEQGQPVRTLSRVPARLQELHKLGAEVVQGDLTNGDSLADACQGVGKVLAAAHAFTGTGANSMSRVDELGNRTLIDSAKAAGVNHFVFTSACTSAADPVDFFRVKYGIEQYLRASGLPFTILRPGAFMEDHAERIGRPVVEKGWTMVFGKGEGLANYVAVRDVAELAVMVLRGPARDQIVWIGGPENLSALDVVRIYERVGGRKARVYHIPERALRAVRHFAGALLPVVRRVVDVGLFMETGAQRIEMQDTLTRYPLRLTTLDQFVRQRYGEAVRSTPASD
jgi:uncharacterized protein YbjT (DUF2867 family)